MTVIDPVTNIMLNIDNYLKYTTFRKLTLLPSSNCIYTEINMIVF
jgi:hypothetical protein